MTANTNELVPVTHADALTIVTCDSPPDCDHEFAGWRMHDDGLGGEQVCTKCGIGAMAYTLSLDI